MDYFICQHYIQFMKSLLNLIKILLCIDDIDCILSIHKNWQSGVMGACRSHSLKVGGSSLVGGGTSMDIKCYGGWWLWKEQRKRQEIKLWWSEQIGYEVGMFSITYWCHFIKTLCWLYRNHSTTASHTAQKKVHTALILLGFHVEGFQNFWSWR